jgi:hypothetical protein
MKPPEGLQEAPRKLNEWLPSVTFRCFQYLLVFISVLAEGHGRVAYFFALKRMTLKKVNLDR